LGEIGDRKLKGRGLWAGLRGGREGGWGADGLLWRSGLGGHAGGSLPPSRPLLPMPIHPRHQPDPFPYAPTLLFLFFDSRLAYLSLPLLVPASLSSLPPLPYIYQPITHLGRLAVIGCMFVGCATTPFTTYKNHPTPPYSVCV
jgi:hypothetical protein